MEKANRMVAEILEEVKERVRPGVETRELDEVAEAGCRRRQVEPAFKGYRGYPASVCVSVNEEVVHGIPGSRCLKDGDLVSLDFGVRYDGYYGDSALTLPVGEVSLEALMDYEIEACLACVSTKERQESLKDFEGRKRTS